MFKKISLITNSDSENIAETLRFLIKFLQDREIEIELDECCGRLLGDTGLPVVPPEQLGVITSYSIHYTKLYERQC